MSGVHQKTILARRRAEELIGRDHELERLYEHSCGPSGSGGLFLLSRPGAGASELLLQTFDRLFSRSGDSIPIYFAFDSRDRNMARSSLRFAREFLIQAIAFGRNEPGLLFASPSFRELAKLVSPGDPVWLDDLIEACASLDLTSDADQIAETCLALPARAAASGSRTVVLLDSIHEAAYLKASAGMVHMIKSRWKIPALRFVLSSHRRAFGRDFDLPRMMLDMPDNVSARQIAGSVAVKHNVAINDESHDLLALQVRNEPRAMDAIVRRAASENIALDSFANIQRVYAEEIFAGGFGAYFDGIVASATPSNEIAQKLVALLFESMDRETPLVPIEKWRKRFNSSDREFDRMIDVLSTEELIRVSSNRVQVMNENIILSDYVRGRYRLEIKGEVRAMVFADELTSFTKRATGLMARHYRSIAALDIRSLMSRFQRRSVPAGLLDYKVFAEKYKGRSEADVATELQNDVERIDLPNIIFTAHTESFYSHIREHIETNRSAIGIGFQTGSNDANDEVVWLAAEIDSKLEVERELAEFWCDRLETAALICDFANYRIWLIAPEGFAVESLEVISQRNGFGSSRRQAELLNEFLVAEPQFKFRQQGEKYDITIPMGGDAELVAARTLEDIARKHGFQPGIINQVKTAVVEACINASEHSLSPDAQIRLSFDVTVDRINITVANRGVRLTDQLPVENAESEARRGWGLKLIERLMDEVRLEQTDDGTRITMSKLLAA